MISGTPKQINCRQNPRGRQLSKTFAEQEQIDYFDVKNELRATKTRVISSLTVL